MSPHLRFSRRLRPTSGTRIWSPAGRRVPGTSLFPFFLVVLEAVVYRRHKPWLQERNPGVRVESPRHGFQEAPSPPPLANESRASGRLQPCQTRPQPPSSRDWPGRPLSPRKRRARDSPEFCPTRQLGVPGGLFPPQYEPAVAACKEQTFHLSNCTPWQ